jgi:solute carrier family 35, member F5
MTGSHQSPAAPARPIFTPSYLLGLFFIVIVAILWSASSVVCQFLYSSNDDDDNSTKFHSPFLVTYIGVSLFSLWLPYHAFFHEKHASRPRSSSVQMSTGHYQDRPVEYVDQQWSGPTGVAPESSFDPLQPPGPPHDNQVDWRSTGELNGTAHVPRNDLATAHVLDTYFWSHRDHFRVACYIAPVWFVANVSYNIGLSYTSITSSTVLASCGSLFTFLFAVCSRDEQFTVIKLVGIFLGMIGSLLTTLNDRTDGQRRRELLDLLASTADDPSLSSTPQQQHPHAVWGDLLALISAIGYGGYAIQTRLLCPHDESIYSMQLVLGYIGLVNMILLAPLALPVFLVGVSHGTLVLSWKVLGIILFKGFFDNVISDYLWLRAVILTSATVATVGLGLTIPLAFVSDVWFFGVTNVLSPETIAGSLAVLVGFVLVNTGSTETAPAAQQGPTSAQQTPLPGGGTVVPVPCHNFYDGNMSSLDPRLDPQASAGVPSMPSGVMGQSQSLQNGAIQVV